MTPLWLTLAAASSLPAEPVALLLPDSETHTKLTLQKPGMALLKSLPPPVSVVSVVGAYRTGKSWLLNELMGISCQEGFMVGHQRSTQTKGVWILARPVVNGTGGTRVYMDT